MIDRLRSFTFHFPDTRGKALALLNQIFAFFTLCYIPYILVMPLYEGRRMSFVGILLGVCAFFCFNSWLCKKERHGLSIFMLSVVMIAGPTILYLKLHIIMTTIWLVPISGLISCFVERPAHAVGLAGLALMSVGGAVWHLSPYVPAEVLHLELGRVALAIVLISAIAYLVSSSYQHTHRIHALNNAKTKLALNEAHALHTQALEALADAEVANEEKSLFLASMSHHLRTPLNAILGYAEILSEELADDPDAVPSSVWTDTERIQIASRHLLALIQDVLNLADIESGTLRMNAQRFDLHALCVEIMTSMELAAKLNHNSLRFHYLIDVHHVDDHDPTWMRQLLFNLLSNAIKFTHDGEIDLHVTSTSDTLIIEVRDSGIGLTPEQLEHILDEFVQADEHTLSKFGGTGLGLPLCHKLIERMHGELIIESVWHQGTCARVRLPWGRS